VERDLFFWILTGLVVGTAAKLAFPGREPGGFIVSLLLGIAGALAGGFLLHEIGDAAPGMVRSVIAASAGAALLLIFYRIVITVRAR
jgi:uncharacterized membrane protein YeaQ/YmgE (transglycosylase-associated protein family)